MDNEYLKVQITRIKQALVILKENQKKLSVAMDAKASTHKYSHLGHIITEYVVIKVAALGDQRKGTFSLIRLKNNQIDSVRKKYAEMLKVMKDNRDKAFGHHEKNFIQTEDIIQASDLLDLPLIDFLDEVEKEL